jgi:hypothetical protein
MQARAQALASPGSPSSFEHGRAESKGWSQLDHFGPATPRSSNNNQNTGNNQGYNNENPAARESSAPRAAHLKGLESLESLDMQVLEDALAGDGADRSAPVSLEELLERMGLDPAVADREPPAPELSSAQQQQYQSDSMSGTAVGYDALATIPETSFESERSPARTDSFSSGHPGGGGGSSSGMGDSQAISRDYSNAILTNQHNHCIGGGVGSGSSGGAGGGALVIEQSTLLDALEASRCEVGVLEERVQQLENHCSATDAGKTKLLQQLQQVHVAQSEPTERLKQKLKSSQREVKDYELYKEVRRPSHPTARISLVW